MTAGTRKAIAQQVVTADQFELDYFKVDFRSGKIALGGRIGYDDTEGNFVMVREISTALRGNESKGFLTRVETQLEKIITESITELTTQQQARGA